MPFMKRCINPSKEEVAKALLRPPIESVSLYDTVSKILADVNTEGDAALLRYTAQFDAVELSSPLLDKEILEQLANTVPTELCRAIDHAKENIYRFHSAQRAKDEHVEVEPGVYCWRKSIPIERVGLYIPGGQAPLFSTLLMLSIPAKIAGCSEIILATPPNGDGTIHPAIAYAAHVCGVSRIVLAGGAQAIGALAYGTESIPKVDKIFGPGNRFVTEAKMHVASHQCAIDMPAGPSEVMVVIDSSSNLAFSAADLLSQAEHGPDSHSVLLLQESEETVAQTILDEVEYHIEQQLASLARKDLINSSLSHSVAIVYSSKESIVEAINMYAPEHLIIATRDFSYYEEKIQHAGSVFLGSYSCESAGDYASGTNHTLPTHGWARSYGGVSLDSYYKKITFQRITKEGLLALGPTIEKLARAESLDAHAQAVTIRMNALQESL